jgi:hypothetical protein
MRHLHCVSFFLLASALCTAQAITVRIVNVKNGHSLPQQSVEIAFFYEAGEGTPAKHASNLQLKTDSDGIARFELPSPPPAHLAIQAKLSSEHWHCACAVLLATQDLTQKGIGAGPVGSASALKGEPGKIIFGARPFTLFERLIYPLMKE